MTNRVFSRVNYKAAAKVAQRYLRDQGYVYNINLKRWLKLGHTPQGISVKHCCGPQGPQYYAFVFDFPFGS